MSNPRRNSFRRSAHTLAAVVIAGVQPALVLGAVVSWANDAGGAWFTPVNWSGNALPQPGDDVVIDRPAADPRVVMTSPTQNTTQIRSLHIGDTLELLHGYLESTGTVHINGTLRIGGNSGSNFAAPVVNAGPGGRIVADSGFASINNATLNCNTYVGGAGGFASAGFGSVWNNGVIFARSAGLNFHSPNLTRASMGTIDALNCSIGITASVLHNAGQILDVGDASNQWTFYNHTRVVGGAITGQTGNVVQFSQARLDRVTLDIDAVVRDGDLFVVDRLDLQGSTITVGGGNPAHIWMEGAAPQRTLGGTGTIVLQSNTADIICSSSSNTPMVVGPGITVRGYGRVDPNGQPFINRGTISADSPFGTLSVYGSWPVGMRNEGTLQVVDRGSLSLSINPQFQQAGRIRVLGGRMDISGFVDQAQLGDIGNLGGELVIAGAIQNTGKTIALDSNTGSWTLSRSTITGGRLSAVGAAKFFLDGSYGPQWNAHEFREGLVVDGPVVIRGGADLKITAPVMLNNELLLFSQHQGTNLRALVRFPGTQETAGQGAIIFDGGGEGILEASRDGGRLTISPGFSVRARGGDGALDGNILNLGSIAVTRSGRRISIEGQVENAGELLIGKDSILRVRGRLFDARPLALHGRLEGDGTISTVSIFGIASPGVGGGFSNPTRAGVLKVEGDCVQAPDALLELVIDPATHAARSRLNVLGHLSIDGALSVLLAGTVPLRPLDSFDLIDFSTTSGQFKSIALPAIPPQWHWDLSRLYVDGSVRLVPDPTATGLVLALLGRRRRGRNG